jgi:hypothetical protein
VVQCEFRGARLSEKNGHLENILGTEQDYQIIIVLIEKMTKAQFVTV